MKERRRSVGVTCSFVILLLVGCLVSDIDARKTTSNRRTSGGSKTHSTGRVSKPPPPQHDTPSKYAATHTDLTKLSYPGYNQQANPPRTQQHQPIQPVHHQPAQQQPVQRPAPSAPELPSNQGAGGQAKPIGWNVPHGNDGGVQKQTVHNTNAAPPYPVHDNVQKQSVHNTNAAPYPQQTHANAPPPYSQYPNNGPPPPYSPHGNANSHINEAPPPYSPHVGGATQYQGAAHYPAGGAQYPPTYNTQQYPSGGHYAGAQYPAASHYPAGQAYPAGAQYPAGAHYPAGGAQYPSQYPTGGGAYPGQYGAQPQINNYYPQKSSGNGLQNALLAGVGGLALYGALKPSEHKTIIIHEGANNTAPAPAAAPADPNAVIPVTPVPAPGGETHAPLAPLAPMPGAVPPNVEQPHNMTPGQPGQLPLQPGQPPLQPGQPPLQPGQPPLQPGQPPLQPGQPPMQGPPPYIPIGIPFTGEIPNGTHPLNPYPNPEGNYYGQPHTFPGQTPPPNGGTMDPNNQHQAGAHLSPNQQPVPLAPLQGQEHVPLAPLPGHDHPEQNHTPLAPFPNATTHQPQQTVHVDPLTGAPLAPLLPPCPPGQPSNANCTAVSEHPSLAPLNSPVTPISPSAKDAIPVTSNSNQNFAAHSAGKSAATSHFTFEKFALLPILLACVCKYF